jgi:hypothetical protein
VAERRQRPTAGDELFGERHPGAVPAASGHIDVRVRCDDDGRRLPSTHRFDFATFGGLLVSSVSTVVCADAVHRQIRPICAAEGSTLPAALCQKKIRGHVTSVMQPGPVEWADRFPLHSDSVPDIVTVVLLSAAATDADVQRMASRARAVEVRCLVAFDAITVSESMCSISRVATHPLVRYSPQVSGEVVRRWAAFLSTPGQYCDRACATLDHAAVQSYPPGRAVPESVRLTAVAVTDEQQARRLRRVRLRYARRICVRGIVSRG